MFYSQFILAKKGPLATIWIAAHLERKLRKNQITDTNIGESVDSILYPEVPIALRLSGHLLLGVVRIYSRKVNLLFNDCSEALVKIHQAFHSSAVDLPPGAVVAPFNSITLPESFDFRDLEAHLSRENVAARVGNRSEFEHHVTARDLITLQDQNDERRLLFTLDERFEDAGNPYAVLDLSIEEPVPAISPSPRSRAENISLEDDVLPPLPMEDDMDFEGMNVDRSPRNAVGGERQSERTVEVETTVEGPPPFPEATSEVPDIEKLRAVNEAGQQEHMMGLDERSVSMDVDDKFPSSKKGVDVESTRVLEETPLLREEPTPFGPERSSPARSPVAFSEDHDILGSILGKRTPKLGVMPTPVSIKRSAKKRKHAFDAIVSLPSVEMKKQLKSTNDICRPRRKGPSTEYDIWMLKRDNYIEQKFSEPSFPGLSYDLKSIYDGVIGKKFLSPRKQHKAEQASTRKTPRGVGRLDPDGKEGVDNMRTIVDPEPFAEEAQNETVAAAVPSAAEDLNTKADDVDVTAGQLSPDRDISFDPVLAMDDEGAVDLARQQDEGVSTMEHRDETTVRDIRENENEAAVDVNDSLGTKTEGLAFLADSRDTDEPANEIAANKRTGKSPSSDSGWSSRSRAVALFLKEKFEAMDSGKVPDQNQNQCLNLEKLLTGRTRKEAARLFFETLVLGTKGYLQVEQVSSYADIQLLASRRLLKAVF